ncbi:MAG: carboxypeptidase regulatory-like domain-containing protein, partial [Candidatus Aminicenantes bacterium]|nr:carboxypeptidase regulatory-like domain-containing protein [Candidatus Aminicenantes bacterium]
MATSQQPVLRPIWMVAALAAVLILLGGAGSLISVAPDHVGPGASRETSISGTVRSEEGPLAGAVVRVKGTSLSVVADEEGSFTLTGLAPGRPAAVTAWAPGYYIGGGRPELPGGPELIITLTKHADDDNPDYAWLPSLRRPGEGEKQGCA